MKSYNIAQVGSFDVENYGDLLFPVVLKYKLDEKLKDTNLYLFSPLGGKMPFADKEVYQIEKLESMHREVKFDAIIIGGGDIIRFDKNVLKLYPEDYKSSCSFWLTPIIIANRYNIPVVFNNPGVPFCFDDLESRIAKRLISNVGYCSVRDELSQNILINCGLDDVHFSPDTIMAIRDVYNISELKLNKDKLIVDNKIPNVDKYLVIQHNRMRINDIQYISEIKKLISHILNETDNEIFLMPIGYVHNDIEFLELLDSEDPRVHVIKEKFSPYDMLSVFASSSGFIGTSLHGLITTSAYDIPILCLNTMKLVKTSGYLKLINKENIDVVDVEQLIPIFKKEFYRGYDDSIMSARKAVNRHFDNMVDAIFSKEDKLINKAGNNDIYLDIINIFFEYRTDEKKYNIVLKKGLVYFSDNETLTENQKKEIVWEFNSCDQKYQASFQLSGSTKLIRIDPIEGYVISIKDIEVLINNVKSSVSIPNVILENNVCNIISLDPQIIIENAATDEKNIDVLVRLKMKTLTLEEILGLYHGKENELSILSDKVRFLEQENMKVKQALEKRRLPWEKGKPLY